MSIRNWNIKRKYGEHFNQLSANEHSKKGFKISEY